MTVTTLTEVQRDKNARDKVREEEGREEGGKEGEREGGREGGRKGGREGRREGGRRYWMSLCSESNRYNARVCSSVIVQYKM